MEYINKEKKENGGLYLKLINEISYFVLKNARKRGSNHGNNFVEVCYSQFHRLVRPNSIVFAGFPDTKNDLSKDLQKRKSNYKYLVSNIKKDYLIPDHDEDIDVNPLCLPVFVPSEKTTNALEKLAQKEIGAEIMHFDVNRNIFNSDYKKCLAIPCHQFVNESQLGIIVNIINNI